VVLKRGFSIIEIIVSVIIISVVVLGITKINKQNIYMAQYVSLRNKTELSNTLFLTREALKYDKSKKSAYDLLRMEIKKDKTRQYLKKLERKIFIDDDIALQKMVIPIKLKAIMLKSKYATKYYRFNR
jgi:prepilin-type N-terminal cleavage/methylation domain-containing protein